MNWNDVNEFGVALEPGDVLKKGDTFKLLRRREITCDAGAIVDETRLKWDYRRPLSLAGPRPDSTPDEQLLSGPSVKLLQQRDAEIAALKSDLATVNAERQEAAAMRKQLVELMDEVQSMKEENLSLRQSYASIKNISTAISVNDFSVPASDYESAKREISELREKLAKAVEELSAYGCPASIQCDVVSDNQKCRSCWTEYLNKEINQ